MGSCLLREGGPQDHQLRDIHLALLWPLLLEVQPGRGPTSPRSQDTCPRPVELRQAAQRRAVAPCCGPTAPVPLWHDLPLSHQVTLRRPPGPRTPQRHWAVLSKGAPWPLQLTRTLTSDWKESRWARILQRGQTERGSRESSRACEGRARRPLLLARSPACLSLCPTGPGDSGWDRHERNCHRGPEGAVVERGGGVSAGEEPSWPRSAGSRAPAELRGREQARACGTSGPGRVACTHTCQSL